MNSTRRVVSTALMAALAAGLSHQASAADAKEKCYGITKAGANDCAAADGSHSCAGQSKKDNTPSDWKYVAKGTCEKQGGRTTSPAKR